MNAPFLHIQDAEDLPKLEGAALYDWCMAELERKRIERETAALSRAAGGKVCSNSHSD
jgi:hypothetical protein